jgi:hypothetical protein
MQIRELWTGREWADGDSAEDVAHNEWKTKPPGYDASEDGRHKDVRQIAKQYRVGFDGSVLIGGCIALSKSFREEILENRARSASPRRNGPFGRTSVTAGPSNCAHA